MLGVWADISYLTRVMQDLLGDLTFQEAYESDRMSSVPNSRIELAGY